MYPWIKALHDHHYPSMAGFFYLPALLSITLTSGPASNPDFQDDGRQLLRFIMIPAMLLSWITGVTLAVQGGHFHAIWFHSKLLAVVLLTAVHFYDGVLQKAFAEDRNTHSSKFFRFYNEAPTVLMIAIVIFVIVKPF